MVSKPSVSQTAPQVSDRRLREALVFLGFFCGFLIVGLLGLGIHNIISVRKSAAKLSSIKVHLEDHLLTRCDQISNLTADRDRLQARIINVTKEIEKLKSETRTVCPGGWELISGRCYFFSTGSAPWGVSRSSCRRQGGDLAIIDTAEKQRLIRTPIHSSYWIGLSDYEQEGVWKWVDGSALTVSFWFSGQPNNGNRDPKYGEQDCGYTFNSNWNDYNCNSKIRFICEKPLIAYEQF